MNKLSIFIDVDDTLVRTTGTKRIPRTEVIERVRELHQAGHELFIWSSGGAAYAEEIAVEFGIAHLFSTFLPKPDVSIDDILIQDWTNLKQLHPNEFISADSEI